MNKADSKSEKLYNNLPESAGVYLMKDSRGRVLYIGKAANLRRRVSSYFERPHEYKVEKLISEIRKIDYEKTDTAIEALILESRLIRKFEPPFNVKEKDDKSFLWVEVTKEKFPRVLLARGKDQSYEVELRKIRFGPFTSASSIREALKITRRIFPFSVHAPAQIQQIQKTDTINTITCDSRQGKRENSRLCDSRACFDYEIGLCPGTCFGAISRADYLKNIKNIKLFFEGKKGKIIKSLTREMDLASKKLEFERAAKLRRQIFSLQHIQDIALISNENYQLPVTNYQLPFRIEGYDISNISGTSAVGAMVVWENGRLAKDQYRKFRIRTVIQSDDVGMFKEVLRRRFKNNWPLPSLVLIDGGRGQVNAAENVLLEFGLKIPVVGIAKGPRRKKNNFIGKVPREIDKPTLIQLRNEAHRFAISYHKKLRARESLSF
ncbi:MAG: UvrB/UvrC motif-containing protein [Candidatus Magasanikbacteria bacterium]|nr:UvrB/UvrC motif-containing protein [Candidatus Magasanikbacteria bacterium]